MGNKLAAIVAVSAVMAFSGSVLAAEEFPTQEATVTTTVTDPEGKVLRESTVSDTTMGADTTRQFRELERKEMKEETKGEEKPAAPAKKKKTIKKKSKKAKSMTETATPSAEKASPEAQ